MSLYKDQKAAKPKVEDVAGEFIDGDKLNNLLDFIGFLKDNKLTPRWQSYNSWSVRYKNKSVCYVNLNDREGCWMIRHSQFTRDNWFVGYEKYITDDEVKEYILDNVNPPPCVDRDCWKRKNMTILGKQYDEVCTCWPLIVRNPDGKALESAKKFILVIKKFIADLAAASVEI